jgi:hypothetical protein
MDKNTTTGQEFEDVRRERTPEWNEVGDDG